MHSQQTPLKFRKTPPSWEVEPLFGRKLQRYLTSLLMIFPLLFSTDAIAQMVEIELGELSHLRSIDDSYLQYFTSPSFQNNSGWRSPTGPFEIGDFVTSNDASSTYGFDVQPGQSGKLEILLNVPVTYRYAGSARYRAMTPEAGGLAGYVNTVSNAEILTESGWGAAETTPHVVIDLAFTASWVQIAGIAYQQPIPAGKTIYGFRCDYSLPLEYNGNPLKGYTANEVDLTLVSFGAGQRNIPTFEDAIAAPPVVFVSPGAQLTSLIYKTADINLANGISNSLDKKLDNAFDAWEAGTSNDSSNVLNKMEAFINAVEAQRGKEINDYDADTLTYLARNIIGSL